MRWLVTSIRVISIFILFLCGYTTVYAAQSTFVDDRSQQVAVADWEREAEQKLWNARINQQIQHKSQMPSEKYTHAKEIIALSTIKDTIITSSKVLIETATHVLTKRVGQEITHLASESVISMQPDHLYSVFTLVLSISAYNLPYNGFIQTPEEPDSYNHVSVPAFALNKKGSSTAKRKINHTKIYTTMLSAAIRAQWHAHLFDKENVDYFKLFLYIWEDNPRERCVHRQRVTGSSPSWFIQFLVSKTINIHHQQKQSILRYSCSKQRTGHCASIGHNVPLKHIKNINNLKQSLERIT